MINLREPTNIPMFFSFTTILYWRFQKDVEYRQEHPTDSFMNYVGDLEDPNRTEKVRHFIDHLLLDELHILENDFATYISDQIKSDDFYAVNSNHLIFDLLTNDITDKEIQNADTIHNSLLNFNYSQPEQSATDPTTRFTFDYVKNVHGNSIDKNAIFGVDYSQGEDDDTVQFTKTFRSMTLQSRYSGKSFFDHMPIDKIKVYGHSLDQS